MPASSSTGTAPGTVLDYVEQSNAVNVTATTQASPTTIVTGNSIYVPGKIRIEFYCPGINTNNFTNLWCDLYEDGTSFAEMSRHIPSNATDVVPGIIIATRTPTRGYHTYSVGGYTQSGFTIEMRANASYGYTNMFLRVTATN